ncbi:MAG: aminoglycoside phosphotransferase, partial [Cellulomonadaceae bacterium]|nr:aminoglycoside phosphotransferase [Cellulomonadaceae bacterium]
MRRSPLALAALATAAVPGFQTRAVRSGAGSDDFDVATVTALDGSQWEVRAPLSATAGMALEAESALLDALGRHHDSGDLPFTVPVIAGSAPLPEGGRAVVVKPLTGTAIDVDGLAPGPGLAADLGRAIAS